MGGVRRRRAGEGPGGANERGKRGAFGGSAPPLQFLTTRDKMRTYVPSVEHDESCQGRTLTGKQLLVAKNRNPMISQVVRSDVQRTEKFSGSENIAKRLMAKNKALLRSTKRMVGLERDSLVPSTNAGSTKARRRSRTSDPAANERGGTVTSTSVLSSAGGGGGCLAPSSGSFGSPHPNGLHLSGGLRAGPPQNKPEKREKVDPNVSPMLAPYRGGSTTGQVVTFGHRPSSASRVFNPCTMSMAKITGMGARRQVLSVTMLKDILHGETEGVLVGHQRQLQQQQQQQQQQEEEQDQQQHRYGRGNDGMREEYERAQRGSGHLGMGSVVSGMTGPGPDAPHYDERYSERREGVDEDEQDEEEKGLTDFLDEAVQERDQCQRQHTRSDRGGASGRVERVSAGTGFNHSRQSSRRGKAKTTGTDSGAYPDTQRQLRRIMRRGRDSWDQSCYFHAHLTQKKFAEHVMYRPDPAERLMDKIRRHEREASGLANRKDEALLRDVKDVGGIAAQPGCEWHPSPEEKVALTPRTLQANQRVASLLRERERRDLELSRRVHEYDTKATLQGIPPSERRYREAQAIARAYP